MCKEVGLVSLGLVRDLFDIRDNRKDSDAVMKQPVTAEAWDDGGLGLSCSVGMERVGWLSVYLGAL